jgi:hypothetical protein
MASVTGTQVAIYLSGPKRLIACSMFQSTKDICMKCITLKRGSLAVNPDTLDAARHPGRRANRHRFARHDLSGCAP